MEYRDEGEEWDPQDFPKTDGYMTKRIGAYLLDLVIASFAVIIIFYVMEADLNDAMNWAYIFAISGIVTFIYKTILEAGFGRSIGKFIFGLIVISPDGGASFGQALGRNITNIIPLIGPFIDLIFGRSNAEDDRQKFSDSGLRTLVIEDIPVTVEEPVRIYRQPMKVEPPRSKEKFRLDYTRMRVGHCPRCGAPYRVLPPEDTSFSGLWNHRCTWCNNKIQEND